MTTLIETDKRRVTGQRNPMIFGHFLEHFHRQIYGGVFDPGNPLSDEEGLRKDVIEALKKISAPIIRWPGGCFVSAYHWKNAVGPERISYYDKAWRVEEPSTFGTDEYISLCRKIGCEPYICSNAGTGTEEETADWVEYCNLETAGPNARMRIENGHKEPYKVKYWSVGNENYFDTEIGTKRPGEWGRYVMETAKQMKQIDPTLILSAAANEDIAWDADLLRQAGRYLDLISVHQYWDPLWQKNDAAGYEKVMKYTLSAERPITKIRNILGALGETRLKVAFDEWNTRGWHHPFHWDGYLEARNENDRNETYTMADAIFTACFLNACLKNCDLIVMANYAPSVNTRGLIYAYPDGIVLRTTYHVFDMFVHLMHETVIDCCVFDGEDFMCEIDGKEERIPCVDAVATVTADGKKTAVSLINRHPEKDVTVRVKLPCGAEKAVLTSLSGHDKDDYNDVGRENSCIPVEKELSAAGEFLSVTLPAHSVNVLNIS